MVVANPSISTTVGGPVGFWASELTHAYYEFTEVGYQVDIASPKGGKVEFDAFSDPRDPSGYSAHDILSMGFIHTPHLMALLDSTKSLNAVSVGDYDAIVVAGGQAPMFTFPTETRLHQLIAEFYEAEKVTAALCHGTCALLYVKLSDGKYLVEGKTMTGFANVEEDFADSYVGQKVMPFRIEDEAKKLGANFITGGLFKAFATRDGRLITGQQQYSGKATASEVIKALGA
jgi:putative intracellular protease/amidase